MYSSAIAPSRHLATVTMGLPSANSPTAQVHSPDPNVIGWEVICGGVPPTAWTYAFIASMCAWTPCVGSWPFRSTRMFSVLRSAAFPVVLLTLMTYVVMPLLTQLLRDWLYPSLPRPDAP